MIVVGGVLFALAGILGAYRIVATAITQVLAGRGADTYRTVWFMDISYVGILVFCGAAAMALAVAVVANWKEERLWRDFERKYGGNGS